MVAAPENLLNPEIQVEEEIDGDQGLENEVDGEGVPDAEPFCEDEVAVPIPTMDHSKKKSKGKKTTLKDCELQLKARRAKYEHLNLFSEYDTKLHIQALYNGYRQSQRNRKPRDNDLRNNFTFDDLEDEYHISLVEYVIAMHNKKVEDSAKLAFEELVFIDTCNSLSRLEYHLFFVAHKLSKHEVVGGYYAEVFATYPEERIHVESFCSLRNAEVDGSWSHKLKEDLRLAERINLDESSSDDESESSSNVKSSPGMTSNANEVGSESLGIGISSDSV